MKRWLPLLLALSAIAAATWFALSAKRPATPLEPTLQPYVFGNPLPGAHPPEVALRPENLNDPVKRALARIEWGPPDIFYWTQRHLPVEPAAREELARGLVRRYEQVLGGAPMLGARFLQALGVLADPAGLETLKAATQTKPDFLRITAIHALAGFPFTEELKDLYAKLSVDPSYEIVNAAQNEYVKRDALGDEEAIIGFLESSRGDAVIPWLQQVSTRRLARAAEACAGHLEGETPRARQNAILALLTLRDPRGIAAAREELKVTELKRLVFALTLYRDAKIVPPLDDARRLADHPQGEVRRYLAQALGPWNEGSDGGEAADEEATIALLRRLATDTDPVVARTAVEQLWKHGRQEGVAAWREQLRHGHGSELKEAAQVLCETVKDPVAATIVRERLSGERLDGTDQANLLYGLRFYADRADLPLYVARMERAGGRDDLHVGDHGWLAESAGLYVQTYGPIATRPLVEALSRAQRTRAQVVVLDSLRGVVRGAPAEATKPAAEQVLAIVVDAKADPEARMAALETMPFFDDPTLGARLLALRERIGERTLVGRVTTIFASFF